MTHIPARSTSRRRPPAAARVLAPGLALVLAAALGACGNTDDAPARAAEEPSAASSSAASSSAASSSAASTAAASTDAAVTVEDPWVRATKGSDDPSMTGAFMVIDNPGTEDVTLVGASSSVAGMVQLHEMAMSDGDMVMREVEGGITITAGRGKLLEPGGYHVMLMDLKKQLAPGDEIEIELEFSDGSRQSVTAPVKEFTEEEGHYHEPGASEHAHGDEE